VFPEGSLKGFEAAGITGRIHSLALDQEARILVKDRQGIAIYTVFGLEFAFVIGCPDVIGPLSGCRGRPG
jgi:hypothetical protein